MHDDEDELAELFSRDSQRDRLPDYWLEQLDPDASDDEITAPMRVDGLPPAWMRPPGLPVSFLWQQMRGMDARVRSAVVEVQGGDGAEELLPLVPSGTTEVLGIATWPWRYVGITRVGDTLELWLSAESDLQHAERGPVPGGAWEIATLRVPLTSTRLRKHVFDRVEWRNRPSFVVK